MPVAPTIFPRGGGVRLPRRDGDRRYAPAPRDFMVLHFLRGGDAWTTLNYDEGEGDRSVDQGISLPGDTRVADVRVNLQGDGVWTGDRRIDSDNIARRGAHLDGREVRHIVFSTDDCDDTERRAGLIEAGFQAVEEWAAKHARGSKWIAVSHVNKTHIHIHLILENYDPQTGRRLNFSRYRCEEMQEFDWYSGPDFQPGKEAARCRVKMLDRLAALLDKTTPSELTEVGRLIAHGEGHFDFDGISFRPETLRQTGHIDIAARLGIALPAPPKMADRREGAMMKLRALLHGGQTRGSLIESGRLTVKDRTKAGGALARPTFTFDRVAFRADTAVKHGHDDVVALLGLPTQRVPRQVAEGSTAERPKKRRATSKEAPIAPTASKVGSPPPADASATKESPPVNKGRKTADAGLIVANLPDRTEGALTVPQHDAEKEDVRSAGGPPASSGAVAHPPFDPADGPTGEPACDSTRPFTPADARASGLKKQTESGEKPTDLPPILSMKTDGAWLDEPGVLYIGRDPDTHHDFGIPSEVYRDAPAHDWHRKYKAWLDGTIYTDVEPDRREWILSQLPRLRQAKALLSFEEDQHGIVLIQKAFNLTEDAFPQQPIKQAAENPADIVLQFGPHFGKTLMQIEDEYLRWLVAANSGRGRKHPVPQRISKAAADLLRQKSKTIKTTSENDDPSDPIEPEVIDVKDDQEAHHHLGEGQGDPQL